MRRDGPEQRPKLHIAPSSRRISEPRTDYVIAAVAIGLATVGVVYLNTQREEQPEITPPTPIAGSAIPGIPQAEEEKPTIPQEIQVVLSGRLNSWRNRLSPETSVTLVFYPEKMRGRVIAEKGLNMRFLPSTQSAEQGAYDYLREVETRFVISIDDGSNSSEWIVNEYKFSPTFIDFAAKRVNDEIHIEETNPTPQTPIIVDWPAGR